MIAACAVEDLPETRKLGENGSCKRPVKVKRDRWWLTGGLPATSNSKSVRNEHNNNKASNNVYFSNCPMQCSDISDKCIQFNFYLTNFDTCLNRVFLFHI